MNGHDIAEHARLLSHRRYALVVDADADLIDEARIAIEEALTKDGATTGQKLWQLILRRPWAEVRKRMLDDGPEGRLLRSNSPFSTLIGVRDPEERTRLWQQAKRELSDLKISSERSAA